MKKILYASIVTMLSFCAIAAGKSVYDIGVSQSDRAKDVTLGVWHGDYEKCKALADSAHIPMIVYYGQTGCGRCTKLTETLMSAVFANWCNGKNLILLYMKQGSEGNGYSDSSAGKSFIKSMTNEGGFPYFGYYYLPANGGVVREAYGKSAQNFSATAIINKATSLFGNALTGGSEPPQPGPQPKPQPQVDPATVFSGNVSYDVAYYDANGGLAGVMTIKAAKASRTGLSRVTGKITTLAGKKKSFRGNVQTGANATGSFKVSGMGMVNLVFTRDTVSGEFNGGKVEQAIVGGDFYGNRTFSLLNMPFVSIPEGYEVLTDLLPIRRSFEAAKKWNFGKTKTVKYTGKKGAYVLSGTDSENPSALKLTYKAATGIVNGTFKMYASNAISSGDKRPKLKSYSLKVKGLMVNGASYLYVMYRNDIVGIGVVE